MRERLVSQIANLIAIELELENNSEASELIQELVALNSSAEGTSYYYLYQAALLTIGVDAPTGYQEQCQNMLAKFEFSEVAKELHFTAWTCGLHSQAVNDYTLALKLAQKAIDLEPENQQYINGLGAVQFRAGQFEQALESFKSATASEESENTSNAYTYYFLAMTHWKLDQQDPALETLKQANQLASKELGDTDNPPAWNRKLTLELLQEEAEALINAPDLKPKP